MSNLTKEEYINALYLLLESDDADIKIDARYELEQLIEEHFELIETAGSELGHSRWVINNLNKALDKACELLGNAFDCPYATLNKCILEDNCNDDFKECWKEWCLKDEI